MTFILLSICCSVAVAALLKFLKSFQIALEQIITANYLAAILLSLLLFKPDIQSLNLSILTPVHFSLWILLPSIFIIMALSIRHIGIAKTDIAQRLSLFIPILASGFIFHEAIKPFKIIGFVVGFTAIFFTLHRKNESVSKSKVWIFPLLVLLGFGIIDILFKKIAANSSLSFTTSLFVIFCGAFIVSVLIMLFYIQFKKKKFVYTNIGWGLLLGILNFGNIFFYLKAHQALSDNPSTVFAAMNFGVIALGSFTGVVLFREKLSKFNYFGIFMAVLAVIIITLSQLYAI